MKYQYIPYIWPLLLSGIMSFSLGCFVLVRYRNTKGAVSFAISMFVVTFWSIPNALEMSALTLPDKLLWANVQYIAYCYCPVALVIMVMQFTGYDKFVKAKNILLLLIIPTVTLALVWTNQYHLLVRYDVRINYEGPFPVIAKKYGPAFYIHSIYSHLLNIIAVFLLIKSVLLQKSIYRKKMVLLLSGVLLIVVPNALYILGHSPIRLFDITPVFFGPAGLLVTWSLFRYHMFDLVPLAWATVVRTMDTGIIVIDLQNRILDTNPAFEKMTGYPSSGIITKDITEIADRMPWLYEALSRNDIINTEFSVYVGTEIKVYEAMISPLNDDNGSHLGKMAILYEITDKKKAQEEQLKQQWEIAVREERERIARDMHDNLGQILGFINLQAQGISKELNLLGVQDVTDRLSRLVDATQQAHKEIRDYIKEMRSSALVGQNFIINLKSLLDAYRNQTGIVTELEIPDRLNIDILKPENRLHLLNIIKEALNNIRKHAAAKKVRIQFQSGKEYLSVTIEDDGKGFTLHNNKESDKSKFGLDIMKERASEIGAELSIRSAPAQGCKITLMIPVEGGTVHGDEDNAGG